jgi:hypothetical protein
MSRRIQDLQTSIRNTEEKIRALENTPLEPIGVLLANIITTSSSDQKSESIEPVLDHVISILNRFPELTERFYLDACLIQSISDSWSQGKIQCSKMIIPSYRHSWAHEIVRIPHIGNRGELTSSTKFQTIDLIYIRNKYKNKQPNLLDYPWLFHEMGHYLIARHGKSLLSLLLPIIEELTNTLQLRALADRDIARIRAKDTIDEIKTMWSPTSEFSRWTHEIAIDTVGLWSCGPAYLNSYYVDHENADPFIIRLDHPPVAIRTIALVEAAKKLGWREYTLPLNSVLDKWERNISDSEHNRYKTLRDKGLIDNYLMRICDYYSDLGVPRFESKDIERISKQAVDIDSQTLAADLVVKAWLISHEQDDAAYQAWEENITNEIREALVIQ